VAWLLASIGRVGGYNMHIGEGVKGPVSLRVRSNSGEGAIQQIADHANLKVKKVGKSIWVSVPK
jgi:hypothetical protein